MDLSIKNEKLIAHFNEECMVFANGTSDAWAAKHPESAPYGFLHSFLEICEVSKIEIDLTYDTLKNINAGLAALFVFQKKHYDHATNVDIVARTLASVLSYIAINEHGFWFRSTCYWNQIQAGKGPKQPLWSGVDSIAVGKKNTYVDFLPACKEAVKPGTILSPSGLSVQVDVVVVEYKKLTGVDLTEYGFNNLFLA